MSDLCERPLLWARSVSELDNLNAKTSTKEAIGTDYAKEVSVSAFMKARFILGLVEDSFIKAP